MQWTVLGPGAMGCLWAYYLDRQCSLDKQCLLDQQHWPGYKHQDQRGLINHQNPVPCVQLVGRHLNRTRQTELHKSGINGQQQRSLPITRMDELKHPLRRVLISTKAFDTYAAFTSLLPYITEQCQVLLLCNGIQVQQTLALQYPNHRLYALVTAVGAYLTAPFHVVHAGQGASYIGPLTTSAETQPITEFPLSTQWDPKIQQRLVDKLSVNAVINPLTAIHQCANGDLLREPLLPKFQRLAHEVETLLTAQGFRCSESVLALATTVAENTAANYSSTYQDVYHKRKTELQAFTGFLYEISLKHRIEAPMHLALMRTLQQLAIQL